MTRCETNVIFLLGIDVISIFQESSIRTINNYTFYYFSLKKEPPGQLWRMLNILGMFNQHVPITMPPECVAYLA